MILHWARLKALEKVKGQHGRDEDSGHLEVLTPWGHGVAAVSYTHLDVYKRQNLTNQVKHKTGQTVEDQYALEAARTGDVQARLEQDLARQTAEATADTPKLQRAQDLAESIKRLQAQYADVDNAIHNLKLAQSPNFASHISLAATQPESPLPSRKVIVLVLALPLALFCALATAVILQKLDSRVYIGADVERVLDFSPMAVLPVSEEVGYKVCLLYTSRCV